MRDLLTPKQVARAIGVSESSLKRWCDRGVLPFVLTPGGHRRLSLGGVMTFIRQTKTPLVDPEVLGLPVSVGKGEITLNRAAERLYEGIVAGEEEIVRQTLFDLYLAEHRISAIADKVLAPVFHRVGDSWECGAIDVYQERRSCEIVVRLLHEMRSFLPVRPADAPLAIGATPGHDFSSVGNTLCELALRENGWNAQSLGSGIPFSSIAKATLDQRPKLVWLSVGHIHDEDRFVAEYTEFHDATKDVAAIVVGGRAMTESVRERMRFSAYGESFQRLEDFAGTLHRAVTSRGTKRTVSGNESNN